MSHTAIVGGAERSLLELLRCLRGSADLYLVTPEGELAHAARAFGTKVIVTAPVELSFRVGPRRTLRGIATVIRVARDVRSASRSVRADIVHANSVRAGLAAIVASWFGAPRPIVHVRDSIPGGLVGSIVARFTRQGARRVMANSAHTASTLGASDERVHVLHNPVDVDRFAAARETRDATRRALGIADGATVITVVAQLTPWKGQDDAIRILANVQPTVPDACLLLVGEAKFVDRFTRYNNHAYAEKLRALAHELGVAGAVRFLGQRPDIPEIVAATDVVLVPSWHEPFGRIVVESMAAGVPVIATSVGGPAELIEDGSTGLLLPPRSPGVWSAALLGLLADDVRRGDLGRRASEVAPSFRPEAHAAAIQSHYRAVSAR